MTKKLITELEKQAKSIIDDSNQMNKTQLELTNRESNIENTISSYKNEIASLNNAINFYQMKINQMDEWINQNSGNEEIQVDSIVVPTSVLSNQLSPFLISFLFYFYFYFIFIFILFLFLIYFLFLFYFILFLIFFLIFFFQFFCFYFRLLNLVAENSALEDTMHKLTDAFYQNTVDQEFFVKNMRDLTRDQYLKLTLVKKISHALGSRGN